MRQCGVTWEDSPGLWRRRWIVFGISILASPRIPTACGQLFKDEGRYIGCCGLRAAEGNAAHLGYYFARPYWRRGFASEACKAFIDAAFTRLGLTRLLADVEEGNLVSEHILGKFGFKGVGREEIPGSGRVLLFYELSRSEW